MTVLSSKEYVTKEKETLKLAVDQLIKQNIQPKITTLLVENDEASAAYARMKKRFATSIGVINEVITFPYNTTEETLLQTIHHLNKATDVHGIMLEVPLPKHIDQEKIIFAIDPTKDLDGLHPVNLGKLLSDQATVVPNTALASLKLIELSKVAIEGKTAVVVGRSTIVGKPLALLLLKRHATVTLAHSRTESLESLTKQADILCVAIGRANNITGDMIKPGAVVIDIGTNYDDTGKVTGDTDFDSVSQVARFVTPVPGGVGPLTNLMLFQQLITRLTKEANRWKPNNI